jgi:DNA polymerase-3 subunit delta'
VQYSEIVGQKEAKKRMLAMVNEQRVPHALMFAGADGSGNLPAALVFAQHLFCKNPSFDGPCNNCTACKQVSKLSHPDLHLVFPIIKSKTVTNSDDLIADFREAVLDDPYITINKWSGIMDAGNKQPVIPVEEANMILKKLSYTSFEGSYKMMVIWQPEKMNAESANRLLKILEEPPDKTIFVLVAAAPDQLLPTILSRVQLIPFYQSSEEEIIKALVARFHVNEQAARQAALLSDGNYAEAVASLSESEDSVSFLGHFQAFMRLAIRFEAAKAIRWIDENASTGREKQKQFLQYGLQVFRDSLMFNYGERSLVRLSGEELSFLEKFAPFVTTNNYQLLVEEFNTNYYYVERNANPKILFMDLLLKTSDFMRRK